MQLECDFIVDVELDASACSWIQVQETRKIDEIAQQLGVLTVSV